MAGGRSEVEASLLGLALGYAAAVDALDGAAFADLFTDDGELWVPDLAAGGEPTIRRAGREQLERIPSGLARYRATHHAVRASDYEVTGGTATGEVTGVAHHLRVDVDGYDGGTDVIWYLRYVDDYVDTAGAWRIVRRVLHLQGIEERAVSRLGPERPSGGERTLWS
ncbi:MAG TPA: nuclear transport factor 2 family protein [Acidimicrobiales bacterium]